MEDIDKYVCCEKSIELEDKLFFIKNPRQFFSKSEMKWHNIFLKITEVIAEGSHCVSKKVGALVVKNKRIISTGINGTPPGLKNCDDIFNGPMYSADEHHEWSLKNELHAEINALMIAAKEGIAVKDADMYIVYSPCTNCCKSIIAAGIKNVFFRLVYEKDIDGLPLLHASGVNLYKVEVEL
jgi:dCMP deaminase